MTANLTAIPREDLPAGPARGSGWLRARAYRARAGLSTPIVTVLDRNGRVIADEQRAVIHYAVQGGAGANIIFAAGTTGEWNRLDNRSPADRDSDHGRRMRADLSKRRFTGRSVGGDNCRDGG